MRAWMISTDTNNVRPRGSWIKILLDMLRLSLGFRLRRPEIDDVRNPLIAHAVICSTVAQQSLFLLSTTTECVQAPRVTLLALLGRTPIAQSQRTHTIMVPRESTSQ